MKKSFCIILAIVLFVSQASAFAVNSSSDVSANIALTIEDIDSMGNYSISELKVLFPEAQLSVAQEENVRKNMDEEGTLPLSLTKNAIPVQEFEHEFEDGSKTYLKVYADGSRSSSGFSLGTETNYLNGYRYTDTYVYQDYGIFYQTFKVTHDYGDYNQVVSTKEHYWGLSGQRQGNKGGVGSGYIEQVVAFNAYEPNLGWVYAGTYGLRFTCYPLGANVYTY